MKNVLQTIIVEEVKRHYRTEKDFYEGLLGITQQSWNRWKKGERGLKAENMYTLKLSLFTDYEWMLLNKVSSQMSVYPNNFKQEPFEQYLETKKVIAKEWAKRASINVNAARNADNPNDGRVMPGVRVTVNLEYGHWIEDTLTFYTDQPSGHIPAGKKNRLEWFMANVGNLK